MKIIVSPTKKMRVDNDDLLHTDLPILLKKTEKIYEVLAQKTFSELKEIWKCNDDLIRLNQMRLDEMNLYQNLTPALFAYEGLVFQHISPISFDDKMLEYVQNHLRILSGFYGVLRCFDGVQSYRLEMQSKLIINQAKDLYHFWNRSIYDAIDDHMIVNLASKEYSKCIEDYLTPKDRMITCVFMQEKNGKLMQKATFAKIARGEMVRFMAEHNIQCIEDLKKFRWNYRYCETYSSKDTFVFLHDIKSK